MVATSYLRGHPIEYFAGEWVYADTGEPAEDDRPCIRCGEMPTLEGYDACTGYVPGASSVCCGHGVSAPVCMLEAVGEVGADNGEANTHENR